jgi:hypothetical protein
VAPKVSFPKVGGGFGGWFMKWAGLAVGGQLVESWG